MINAITSNKQLKEIVISTGNILNVNNELGIKLNEESSNELLDGLELTFIDDDNAEIRKTDSHHFILRGTKELNDKLSENDRAAISIGAKIFIRESSSEHIQQAIPAMLDILKTDYVDKLVLANPNKSPIDPKHNGEPDSLNQGESINALKEMWGSLEEFAKEKKIIQLGIADVDTDILSKLHSETLIPPTIVQINLTSCCKVPIEMQEFCTKHDIQLLTHSDPDVILREEEFIVPDYAVDWILRYQVHLRCRGVLIAKGYILGARKVSLQTK